MINKIKLFFSDFKKNNDKKLSVNNLNDFKYFNAANKLFNHFKKHNNECNPKIIGGSVRKLITGEPIDDMDVAINLDPKKLKKILIEDKIKFIETGIEHGTITVLSNGYKFEITSLRKDLKTDGRHAEVEFTSDWEEDASRRDFTINAIYCNVNGEVYDPLNGLTDFNNGIVKFIGDPNKRVQEDYLRILRYLRFYIQYNKNDAHDQETTRAIKKNLDGLKKISKERLIDELFKIIKLNNFNKIFNDEFCKFVFLSIFPQVQNYKRFIIKNKISNEILKKFDKILKLAVLLIDETDNCDFFLYKYKLSNENKKRILFIKNTIKNYPKEYFFSKKNILKLVYLADKSLTIDLLIFLIFLNPKKIKKIENLIEYINLVMVPKFPLSSEFLKKELYMVEGKELGNAIKILEKNWIDNNFEIKEENLKKILKLK